MGKQKLSHKTRVNSYFPLQNFQGLAGVDFRSVKLQLTFLCRIFIALLLLDSSSEYSRPVAWARCASNIMDNFIRRRMGSGPKPQRNDFFGVFTHYCTKPLAIFLQCSDDTQTYRIVDHFNLKGGKTKIESQNSSQFLFTTSEISRVSRSWFSLREILLTFLFRIFIALLRLHSSSQYSCPVAWARCVSNIMDNFIRKRMGSGPKATKKWFFWGFHTLLH